MTPGWRHPARRALLATGLAFGSAAAVASDSLPAPLTAVAGDALRGSAIVSSRQTGLCILCHAVPGAPGMHGNIGPDLAGVGARLSAGQLRLRIVDSRRVLPQSVMPAYHLDAGGRSGLNSVATAWRDRPLLLAQEVEDVVAFLETLR